MSNDNDLTIEINGPEAVAVQCAFRLEPILSAMYADRDLTVWLSSVTGEAPNQRCPTACSIVKEKVLYDVLPGQDKA